MLVLTRKADECIRIGDDIKIHVVQIDGYRVRLAIEAPKETRILRGELAEWGPSEQPKATGEVEIGPEQDDCPDVNGHCIDPDFVL